MKVGLAATLVAMIVAAACASDGGSCQRQLDICLRRSPPGASTSDCYAAYDTCLRQQQQRPSATADED